MGSKTVAAKGTIRRFLKQATNGLAIRLVTVTCVPNSCETFDILYLWNSWHVEFYYCTINEITGTGVNCRALTRTCLTLRLTQRTLVLVFHEKDRVVSKISTVSMNRLLRVPGGDHQEVKWRARWRNKPQSQTHSWVPCSSRRAFTRPFPSRAMNTVFVWRRTPRTSIWTVALTAPVL